MWTRSSNYIYQIDLFCLPTIYLKHFVWLGDNSSCVRSRNTKYDYEIDRMINYSICHTEKDENFERILQRNKQTKPMFFCTGKTNYFFWAKDFLGILLYCDQPSLRRKQFRFWWSLALMWYGLFSWWALKW